MTKLNNLDKLFVVWAFLFQVLLIVHFAIRKYLFESYTVKYGWMIYALCIPAVVISIVLICGGESWSFWLGGFLFLAFAIFGYWVDYMAQIQFRSPLQLSILFPYAFLYLATVMFYWWPLALLSRPLWFVYAIVCNCNHIEHYISLGKGFFAMEKTRGVLVARITRLVWTPLFALASAMVIDVGGPLSHSSVVARECGIPAVMTTDVATRQIKDGQTITMDGSAGMVKIG